MVVKRGLQRGSPPFHSSAMVALLLGLGAVSIGPRPIQAIDLGGFFGRGGGEGGERVIDVASDAEEQADHLHRGQERNAFGQPTYGVDVSFPIHHQKMSDNYADLPHNVDPDGHSTPRRYRDMAVQPLGDRNAFYEEFLNGCKEHYGRDGMRCVQTERDRIDMSLRQPASMQNYTDMGFKKIRAPEKVWKLLEKFWNDNNNKQKNENWPRGNTYTNHWLAPTKMVSVEDTSLRGGGGKLKRELWDAARSTIEEWTGEELTQCSLYGIRVYTEGSILATHVDRMPLVSSAIINVAQDVDEPWPIEVYAHDGKAYNVTMEPGDMVLYESHSVLHGRPFPLKGRYYANVFIHFEPTGHSLRHNAKEEAAFSDVEEKYRVAAERGAGGHEAEHDGLPSYIKEGTIEEARWRRSHPVKNAPKQKQRSFATGTTEAHTAAQEGDVDTLSKVVDEHGHLVHAHDENGWTPLHEGARGGHKEVVELLVKKGANVNERTNGGRGETPLWWSIDQNGDDHPVSRFLKSVGAVSIGPEL